MARSWKEEGRVTDWTEVQQQGTSGKQVATIFIRTAKSQKTNPYVSVTMPNNPDWNANFVTGDSFFDWDLIAPVRAWLSETPGGSALGGFVTTVGPGANAYIIGFTTRNSTTVSREVKVNINTRYYLNFQSDVEDDKGQGRGGSIFVRARSYGSAYVEKPVPPPEPSPEPEPVPEPPPDVEVEPPEETETEVPPPTTEGPIDTTNPDTDPTPDPTTPAPTTTVVNDAVSAGELTTAIQNGIIKELDKIVAVPIPNPEDDVDALYRSVVPLKIAVEQLTRQRGDRLDSALLVKELANVLEGLVPVLDERYGQVDDSNLADPLEVELHLRDTSIHITDAPVSGVWGRVRGAWVRVLAPGEIETLKWYDIIDDGLVVLNKTWSSVKLQSLFSAIDQWQIEHVNNPDAHHPQFHDLDSHTDVDAPDPELAESLVWDGTNWVNGEARHQLSESNPTGLVQGGELNIGPGANDIEVIAGLGVVMDSYTDPLNPPIVQGLEWFQINEAITAASAVAGSTVHFTIYDTGAAGSVLNGRQLNIGALRQYPDPPTEPTRRDEIYLGVAVHNGDAWGEISSPIVINNASHTLAEFLKRVAGPTFVIDGGTVQEAGGFTIDQDAGTVWEHNRNWHVNKKDPHREAIPATTGIQWKYVNRDFTSVSGLTGIVDPTAYDDNGAVTAVPGNNNRCTVQQLYQDPRDNYWVLWGQQIFDNATEAAASVVAPTEVPPLLSSSVLLGYIVVEKGQSDWDQDEAFILYPQGGGGTGGGGVPITTYLGLADTPGAYTGDARKVPAVDDLEANLLHDYRTKMVGYIGGQTYYPQETVFQDGWLMVANTITTDYPAPTPVGDPSYTLPDVPAFQAFNDNSIVASGHLYTFNTSGYFRSARVWVPETGNDVTYRLTSVRNPNGSNPRYTTVDQPLLNPGTWNIVAVDTILLLAGEELLFYIEALNSGSSVSPGGTPADWIRQTSSNTTLPTTGNWNTNIQGSLLRIHEDTADAALIDLTGVIPGSTFSFVDTNDPNTSVTYLALSNETYDAGNGVYSWTVAIDSTGTNGAPGTGTRALTTITVPVAAATKFNGIPAYWNATTLPTWAAIESYLQYDGVTQPTVGDEAYSIDISFQELTESDDWDIFGLPSGGGGGGGGSLTLDARVQELTARVQELTARLEAVENE